MAWQTPNINWQAEIVPGASDFNRIEGNIQHLAHLLYAGWVELSNTPILVSTTTKSPTGSASQIVKRFMVCNPGRYRIKVEGKVWGGPTTRNLIRVVIGGISYVFTGWTGDYTTKVYDTPPIPGLSYIDIGAMNDLGTYSYYSSVRKVEICGTLTLNRPNDAILIE